MSMVVKRTLKACWVAGFLYLILLVGPVDTSDAFQLKKTA
jgi:hypothetical protein